MNKLKVALPGLELKNPIMPASGTFGFGDMYHDLYDYNELGAIVLKSATLHSRVGNEDPKFHPLKHGALNAVGLKNPGVDVIVEKKLPPLQKYNSPVIASVAGETEEEFVEVAKRLCTSEVVSALEINVSCPNVKKGGLTFGTQPDVINRLTKKIKEVATIPIYVKLTPNVTDITEVAKAAEDGGADGLSMINTVLGMGFDVHTRKPVLGNIMGGLSGEYVFPLAVRMVYQVAQTVDIPIIGIGGIYSVDDVIQMFYAGASAVQIGTATYKNPIVMNQLIAELPQRMDELGIQSIEELITEVRKEQRNG